LAYFIVQHKVFGLQRMHLDCQQTYISRFNCRAFLKRLTNLMTPVSLFRASVTGSNKLRPITLTGVERNHGNGMQMHGSMTGRWCHALQ